MEADSLAVNMSFYLTLPSNSSYNFFPDNRVNDFFTKLPQHIDLQGRWEVALMEMTFPVSWLTVKANAGQCTIKLRNPVDNTFEKARQVFIPEGYYKDGISLIESINTRIEGAVGANRVKFEYDAFKNKIKLNTANAIIHLSDDVRDILGFESNTPSRFDYDLKDRVAEFPVDLSHGMSGLFVYCNLLQSRVVGDAFVPLLRMVSADGKHGTIQHREFIHVHYVPLQVKSFNTINIYINDDIGKPVSFNGGISNLTLHFRRVPLSAS